MRVVHKYLIRVTDHQDVEMGQGKILTVQTQGEVLCLWALVDPTKPKKIREIRIIGTGHDIPEDDEELQYIGTTQMLGGKLIWHVFEVIN